MEALERIIEAINNGQNSSYEDWMLVNDAFKLVGKTDSEGMDILIKNLGYVDAERFVALMNREPFDYTKWRQSNLEEDSIRNVSHKAMQYVNDTYK